MEREERSVQEYYAIDIMNILSYVWKHAWAVVLSGVLAALIGLVTALFIMKPVYSAEVRLYVEVNAGGVSSSNLTAARSLVKTCGTILSGRSTLDRVIEQAGLDCDWKDLNRMIVCEASGDTEILRIQVSCDDP